MYKNASDCLLTLYFATLNLSILTVFLVASLGFSIYKNISSKNNNFASSFPVLMPFISFACLIVLARTYNTVLNRSKIWHPCLVPGKIEIMTCGRCWCCFNLLTVWRIGERCYRVRLISVTVVRALAFHGTLLSVKRKCFSQRIGQKLSKPSCLSQETMWMKENEILL